MTSIYPVIIRNKVDRTSVPSRLSSRGRLRFGGGENDDDGRPTLPTLPPRTSLYYML